MIADIINMLAVAARHNLLPTKIGLRAADFERLVLEMSTERLYLETRPQLSAELQSSSSPRTIKIAGPCWYVVIEVAPESYEV